MQRNRPVKWFPNFSFDQGFRRKIVRNGDVLLPYTPPYEGFGLPILQLDSWKTILLCGNNGALHGFQVAVALDDREPAIILPSWKTLSARSFPNDALRQKLCMESQKTRLW